MSRLDTGLDWPSEFRRPMVIREARRVANALDEDSGRAYALTAWVAEWELSDGRGGQELHTAAETFLRELERVAGVPQAA